MGNPLKTAEFVRKAFRGTAILKEDDQIVIGLNIECGQVAVIDWRYFTYLLEMEDVVRLSPAFGGGTDGEGNPVAEPETKGKTQREEMDGKGS